MRVQRRAAVAALTASASVGHVGYPAALYAASRLARRATPPAAPPRMPPVTVLVPAYLEAGVIAAKVSDIEANGYPGELEVLVVADGDPETEEKARAAGARTLLLPERRGKSQALNQGMEVASHELVVITDAGHNTLEPGSIAALVRWLEDPGVGAVAGEKMEDQGGSEGVYWRFESLLKRWEADLGTTLGLDGGLCALRRSAWQPIPDDISNDDFWIALDLMERGYRVAYEPTALVCEESIGAVELQWERRTRVLAGGLYVLWRKRRLLSPSARLVSFELLGHKAWRSTMGPLSQAALVLLALAGVRRSRTARLFLLGHAAAGAGLVATVRGKQVPRPLRIAGQLLFLQAVAFGGMLRCLRGDRVLRWPKPAR
jgi:cellulose synthase/poly-beta-1,6-N-acetylglucosamine synthase-like glycosyltransferase